MWGDIAFLQYIWGSVVLSFLLLLYLWWVYLAIKTGGEIDAFFVYLLLVFAGGLVVLSLNVYVRAQLFLDKAYYWELIHSWWWPWRYLIFNLTFSTVAIHSYIRFCFLRRRMR